MKIVRIYGGLGNQMFQYALAVALKCRYPDEQIYIDRSVMRGYPLHNGFELDRVFDVRFSQASQKEIVKVGYPLPHYRLWQLGRHLLPRHRRTIVDCPGKAMVNDVVYSEGNRLYDGYWQSEKYFSDCADSVREAFRFPAFVSGSLNDALCRQMDGKVVVGVHVRRGDYLNIPTAASICSHGYYAHAVKMMRSMCMPDMFIVLSDDADWCRANMNSLFAGVPVEYVDWNRGYDSFRDMQLLSMCTHTIVSNSSFSWWGGWLNANPDKIVIAPSPWMADGDWSDILPHSWVKIPV